MATKREFTGGQADLSGQTINELLVGDVVSRHPLKWSTICMRCLAASTALHSKLSDRSARCLGAGCGRDTIREVLAETPAKVRRQQAEKDEAQRREVEATAAARIQKAEAEFTDAASKLARTIRERIATQRDHDAYIDPATLGINMTQAEAEAFNKREAALFVKQNPSFPVTDRNLKALGDYFDRNLIRIVSAKIIAAAVTRLGSYGLLDQPEVKTTPKAQPRPYVNLSVAPLPEDDEPRKHVGLDLLTGEEREFTNFQVEQMSGSEFSRVFRLKRSPAADGKEWAR